MRFLWPLLLSSLTANAEVPWAPTVKYRGGEAIGVPAKQHRNPRPQMEIVETEECEASVRSPSAVRVGERCGIVRALYRYFYTPEEGTGRRQVLIEFSMTRSNKGGFALLVGDPVDIGENDTPPPAAPEEETTP